MDFTFTAEQEMIAETAKSFFRENATSERTRAAMAADGADRDLWRAFCGELGLSGIGIRESDGGIGLGMVEFAIVAEAAGAQVAALPHLGLAVVGQAIAAGGSDEQKARHLPQVVSGETICAFGEVGRPMIDDGRFTASVQFVPHGAIAGLILAIDERGAWLVRSDAPGVDVAALVTLDQTRPYAAIQFDHAEAEPLADPAAAFAAAQAAGWLCLAAEALGGAQECLDRTVAYAKERVQFGRPIGSFQAYKHRAADMMVEIEQARSAVFWAACAIDEDSTEASLALHAAKSFCADTYFKCAADMIQLHGGIGFTWEHDAHLYFKRARAIHSMMGDGNLHREAVAKIALGEAA